MTLSEFRSWLDGFSEAIVGAPNEDQWAKIKAKLATVDAAKHETRIGGGNAPNPITLGDLEKICRVQTRPDPTKVYTTYGVGDQSDSWRLS